MKKIVTKLQHFTSYVTMSSTIDQQYVEKTLAGDTMAFGYLVEKYQDFVFTIAVRILKSKEEAEEVAQDSFIKAFESLSSYRGEAKFSSWLYSIVYRKALDSLRKNKKHRGIELIEDITEGTVESIDNALQFLQDEERKKAIRDCIGKLSESEAAIITFYYFEDLSVREISGITELSEENIKVKLFRSRKKLFTLLKHSILPEISNTNGRAI
ncbi:RNA polymerase sigma factor [Ulvibacter antarcticus]|uniref:RNA polymerase sigma factor n=1 Tax=Ulvibacter antarcticus TaxID=442714 RepID=A0A3L9YB36_9FLAO|nr:RNA polymerase sigma factor [Ulvibacter antarcticus]RMA57943.1 RNA polymerase sigma-70 factor (ECF subfamily) [Ulvibacter antarcticus]